MVVKISRERLLRTGYRLVRGVRRRACGPRCLGVLLCYNDGDFLPEAIEHLLDQNHDVYAVNHGSTDDTADVLFKYRRHIKYAEYVPRSFDFYNLYPWVSEEIITKYAFKYDWISWPNQDEILEGPDRSMSYYDWVEQVLSKGYDWARFNNINYWHTRDDPPNPLTQRRVRHYCIFPDCAPRIRAWRASRTNKRVFNHNPLDGHQYVKNFNLRHYPIRSEEQMMRRIGVDREGLQRGTDNYHYNYMKKNTEALFVESSSLHYDNGKDDLSLEQIFDWRSVYGGGPNCVIKPVIQKVG